MMKNIIKTIIAGFLFIPMISGCSDFGDVNVDPENPNEGNMDFKYLFTEVQAQIAGSDWDVWRNSCIYSANMIQHMASADWADGVFYTRNESFNAAYWDGFYCGSRAAIRNIIEVMYRWKDKPNYKDEVQFARVMKAYMFQTMTDLYGDIPYSEAGQVHLGGPEYPKYDRQEAIYDDLLKELDEVNTNLKSPDGNNVLKAADVIYQGNTEKWRKFANSLMLRVAMRLVKVQPDKAKTWAQKAYDNGLFTSNDEHAILNHNDALVSNDSAEPFGKILSDSDPEAFYLSSYFIDKLKDYNDPRLQMIATRCAVPGSKWSGDYDLGDSSDPESLIGLPMGYSTKSGDWSITQAPGFPGDNWRSYYALANRKTFARPDVPSILVTYAETELLLSEAIHRGYVTNGGTAKQHFETGIRAAMEQFQMYPAAASDYALYLSSEKVDAYVTAQSAKFDENPLKAINWEYYVTSFSTEYETFSNWRRSGYPELKSIYDAPYSRPAYPNRVTEQIPRRFIYPTSETQDNEVNYKEAVKNLDHGDTMKSRVWWDK